jgi:hypothetical protein
MEVFVIECTSLIRTVVNNHNSVVYVDMMQDITNMKTGVFNCTFRVVDSCITDYVLMRNANALARTATAHPTA